jgi:hypothetical protein
MLTITVAQRYSVLVKARNDTLSNFAIHANMDVDMFDTVRHPHGVSSLFVADFCFPDPGWSEPESHRLDHVQRICATGRSWLCRRIPRRRYA